MVPAIFYGPNSQATARLSIPALRMEKAVSGDGGRAQIAPTW